MHVSVLLDEAIGFLDIQPDDTVVDMTLGNGGHSYAIAKRLGSDGMLIGFDADKDAIAVAQEKLKGCDAHVMLIESNNRHIKKELASRGIKQIDKALFDLGLRSEQIDVSGRGFTFQNPNEPLVMTFTATPERSDVTAETVVNRWSEETLADVIYGFGEERYARRIARSIVDMREAKHLSTVGDLVEAVLRAVPSSYKHSRIHPATRTFQAIRMAVNDELGALAEALSDTWDLLDEDGRMVVISFHSLEDRVVKRFFREKEDVDILTKKPIVPTEAEIQKNSRSRSAKMRAARKITRNT